jgi:2,3-bisphosphoglycerate-independent phosphoglycerate mutase
MSRAGPFSVKFPPMTKSPRVVLVVLDGFGERPDKDGNAIRLARTPRLADLYARYPSTLIGASGYDVGLPDRQMGNSEVGHLNLGAGRIVYQDIVRIDLGIKDGSFFENPTIAATIDAAKRSGGTLHLMGLSSPGNVHASLEHAYAVCEMAKRRGLERVAWHAFLDGRDTPPRSAAGYLRQIEAKLKSIGVGRLTSAVGRYYAMDRDKRWDRLEIAWKMLVRGESGDAKVVDDLPAAVEASYAGETGDGNEVTDEFIRPLLARGPDGRPLATLRDGDAAFFWNFRADRARQLTQALHAAEFPHFDRGARPKLAAFSTMTLYDAKVEVPAAFPPQSLKLILGEVLSKAGVSQLRTAETEKYAHVTYFFNGGAEPPFPGEERRLVPSNREVATYDLAPEMSAAPVTDGVVSALEQKDDAGGPRFILVNYANPDMVGHTGKIDPAVHAIETIDTCLGRIVEAAEVAGAAVFITADHGNCETMVDPVTGQPQTAHTTNPVPFLAVGADLIGRQLRDGGRLCDVAPTILAYLGIAQPKEMDGVSLFEAGSTA